jgi:hypothetical protein
MALLAGCAGGASLEEGSVLDLTHAFNEKTVYWPTAKGFELKRVSHGRNPDGMWYASNDYSASSTFEGPVPAIAITSWR